MIVAIVGGGASGMAAAISASQWPNARVLVLERQARVGKKLLATGNGRCNLSNIHALAGGYHGQTADFATPALQTYPPQNTLSWFAELGLCTVTEPTGRVYPFSDQANSVVDVLRLAMDLRPNIEVRTGYEVKKLRREGDGFLIDDDIHCHRLIIACGGLAGQRLGGSLLGYKLLAKFGHRATKLRPSLVQIKTVESMAPLKGVRAQCGLQILRDNCVHSRSDGQIQFTEQGLSGPVMFECSRDVCYGAGVWEAELDLLPQMDAKALRLALENRAQTALPLEELFTGLIHNRLGRVLTKAAGIQNKPLVSQLSPSELDRLCAIVKAWRVGLREPLDMAEAQVTAGGVCTAEFDKNTMESRIVPGLFACGEVLDIDGDCGGYNLQWAWSSGRLAGYHAGKESK